jgi:hypothetical protein
MGVKLGGPHIIYFQYVKETFIHDKRQLKAKSDIIFWLPTELPTLHLYVGALQLQDCGDLWGTRMGEN